MEYAIYPFRYMNITQSHEGIRSHKPHWYNAKDCSDLPFDEACKDSGRQYFEPQNDWRIVEIGGVGSSITNYVRLETVNKVKIPYRADSVILELTLSHIEDADLKQYKVGQILKAGGSYLREGKEGATGYHYHCTANIGKYYGLKQNSNGKWCFVYEKSLTPPQAFYINNSITIINPRGYVFQQVPTTLEYRVYVDGKGWTNWVSSGIAGTTGEKRPLTKIEIKDKDEILAQAHFSYVGWVDFGSIEKGNRIGDGKIECLRLKGNFQYRVHISNFGWTCFTKADGMSTQGTVGQSLTIEAIELKR